MDTVAINEMTRTIGYGYSALITRLLYNLGRHVENTDEFRGYYGQMMNNDETISSALEYLTGRVILRIGEYTHEDERIKNLVDECTEFIKGTLTEARRAILRNTFAYGYSASEFTLKALGGKWLLSSINTLDPLNTKFKFSKSDDNSLVIDSVIQYSPTGIELSIPAGKCLIHTYGDANNPYGQSLLKRCYKWWSFKNELPKMWAVALERYGMPLIHARTEDSRNTEELANALENISGRSYIVTDNVTEITPISMSAGDMSNAYSTAEEFCNKMMYRAMFLPSLLNSGENGGSYSLGQVHLELFNTTCAALAENYIDAELEQLWRPIIEYNYGAQKSYGNYAVNGAVPMEEKQAISTMLMNLANTGMIDADGDRKWIREMLDLPEPEEEGIYARWQLENQRYDV